MEKNTITLEGAKLKTIADKNETSHIVMGALAERKRFRAITDIGHMKNNLIRSGEKIILDDYMKTWKELQDLGVGSIVYGRNGQSNRFKWNYSLTSIGNAALTGKDVEVKQIRTTLVKPKPAPYTGKKRGRKPVIKAVKFKASPPPSEDGAPDYENESPQSFNILYIPLREDFVFDVKIPKLSQKEADTICNAIQRCI